MNLNIGLEALTNMGTIKNSTKSISINEAGIDTLAVDTMQLSMTVNDYLNKIIDIMDQTKAYYQCAAADELRKKFSELSADFPIVTQNIENYAYSLKKAKDNMINRNLDAVTSVKMATANVPDLIKEN